MCKNISLKNSKVKTPLNMWLWATIPNWQGVRISALGNKNFIKRIVASQCFGCLYIQNNLVVSRHLKGDSQIVQFKITQKIGFSRHFFQMHSTGNTGLGHSIQVAFFVIIWLFSRTSYSWLRSSNLDNGPFVPHKYAYFHIGAYTSKIHTIHM